MNHEVVREKSWVQENAIQLVKKRQRANYVKKNRMRGMHHHVCLEHLDSNNSKK